MEYVRVEASLAQPIGAVWGIVSGFGSIKAWIAGVESCVLEGEGVGAVRSVSRGGSVTRERLDTIEASTHRLSYTLLPPYRILAKNVRGHIELKSTGPAETAMTWWSEASEIDGSIADLAAYIGKFYRDSISRLEELLGRPAS